MAIRKIRCNNGSFAFPEGFPKYPDAITLQKALPKYAMSKIECIWDEDSDGLWASLKFCDEDGMTLLHLTCPADALGIEDLDLYKLF